MEEVNFIEATLEIIENIEKDVIKSEEILKSIKNILGYIKNNVDGLTQRQERCDSLWRFICDLSGDISEGIYDFEGINIQLKSLCEDSPN